MIGKIEELLSVSVYFVSLWRQNTSYSLTKHSQPVTQSPRNLALTKIYDAFSNVDQKYIISTEIAQLLSVLKIYKSSLGKAKMFSFTQTLREFQGKENITATEAYKTGRTKDIFGNACVIITNARLFARAILEFPPRPNKYSKMTYL